MTIITFLLGFVFGIFIGVVFKEVFKDEKYDKDNEDSISNFGWEIDDCWCTNAKMRQDWKNKNKG